MRLRRILFLLAVWISNQAGAQFYGKAVHEVGTGAEFMKAIGSDRTLQLTATRIELPPTGAGLVIPRARNLRILGAAKGGTELVCAAGDAVLTFTDCMNLDLRRLTVRLESTAANADGVLRFTGVTNVLIRKCTLSGVAASGLVLSNAARVKSLNSTILNCGDGVARAVDSRNMLFEECRFTRNEGERGFALKRSFDLRMESCEFAENTFKTELIGLSGGGGVVIAAGSFVDNRYPRNAPPGVYVAIKKETK